MASIDPSSWASAVNLRVKVHPVVLFQIADAYERRSMENHRVIGTLVGESTTLTKHILEVIQLQVLPLELPLNFTSLVPFFFQYCLLKRQLTRNNNIHTFHKLL